MKLQKLFGFASTGKVKEWEIEALETPEGYGVVRVTHGYIDGKKQSNDRIIKKGKNIGRSNETTPYEQACSECKSDWNKKRDENYEFEIPDPDAIPRNILPSKANKYSPLKQNIKLPCYGQPKLDGVRALNIMFPRYESPVFQSKGGKVYDTLSHLGEASDIITEVMKTYMLDGEIYKHGWPLTKISRAVKEWKPYTPELEYWLYDIATFDKNLNGPYSERRKILKQIGAETGLKIKIVPTVVITKYSQIKEWHDKFVKRGFEGIMLRKMDVKYIFQFRTSNLLKYKEFDDSEFEIVGYKQGEGLEEGCIVYCCVTKEGKPFDARPKGTREDRQALYEVGDSLIGKMLTIRHQGFTEYDVPQFPVGLEDFREDYE